mmetsp:Transcript_22056/g.31603  ORF Transcript_22056/g.31603 Transcript_22056/m.31603 type:complete len:288 (+) Transcript_22056:44-907(+)
MFIDENFRDWWENHLHRPPIPKDCNVVRVCKAIQGHPESPRLWEKHIDKILCDMHFTPTRHKPCLYRGNVNGSIVLFLRQVDNFSVAASDTSICSQIIAQINNKMTMAVKDLGIISRFNGLNIHQTRHYVKITSEKYLRKMLEAHQWFLKAPPPVNPLPLPSESDFLNKWNKLRLQQPPPSNNNYSKLWVSATEALSENLFGPWLSAGPTLRPTLSNSVSTSTTRLRNTMLPPANLQNILQLLSMKAFITGVTHQLIPFQKAPFRHYTPITTPLLLILVPRAILKAL